MRVFIKSTVLANRDNYRDVVQQLKYIWLHDVLFQTGMDLTDCFPEDSNDPNDQTIEQKKKLRKCLSDNNITVLDDNEDINVYIQDQLIATWKKPSYVLKQDLSQLDPKNRLYIEIKLECWSVFDEYTNEEIVELEE